jgi:hypothetical protein
MRTGIVVEATAAERDRLEAIVADRNSQQKRLARRDRVGHRRRARHGGEQDGRLALAGTVCQEGVDGLLRDKTQPPRVKPFGPEVAERIVVLTLSEP